MFEAQLSLIGFNSPPLSQSNYLSYLSELLIQH
jgi:hypothetical protein